MKILFLQSPGGVINFSAPLGLAYIASYVRKRIPGLDIKIKDLSVEEVNLNTLLEDFTPDIVGISGTTSTAREIRLLIEEIKSINAGIPIILGGAHASALKEQVFYLPVDFAVVGEGEETVCELLIALLKGNGFDNIPGLIFRDKRGIVVNKPRIPMKNLDELPMIDWSMLPMEKYKCGSIVSSRGCPYDCIFCSQQFGRSWRAHSVEYVFAMIKSLVDNYSIETIRFMDDNPLIDKERFKKITKIMKESGYAEKVKLELNHGTRMDIVDRELFLLLKEIGVKNIWFGLESAVSEVLMQMRKRLSLEQITNAIDLANEVGLRVDVFIVIGMPGDTYKRTLETMQFIRKHKIGSIALGVATPFPGTDLYKWVENNGRWIEKDFENWYATQSILFDTEDFTKEERDQAMKQWYKFSSLQRIKVFLRYPKESFRYVKKNPGIIAVSLANLLGRSKYDKRDPDKGKVMVHDQIG